MDDYEKSSLISNNTGSIYSAEWGIIFNNIHYNNNTKTNKMRKIDEILETFIESNKALLQSIDKQRDIDLKNAEANLINAEANLRNAKANESMAKAVLQDMDVLKQMLQSVNNNISV